MGHKVLGVLCDWDLAEQRRASDGSSSAQARQRCAETQRAPANEQAQGSSTNLQSDLNASESSQEYQIKPRHQTGTGPFMAMDLLRSSMPSLHLYRYDLESLFYVLVYICVVLNMQQKRLRLLPEWERPTLEQIGTQKGDFPKRRDVYNTLVGRCDLLSGISLPREAAFIVCRYIIGRWSPWPFASTGCLRTPKP